MRTAVLGLFMHAAGYHEAGWRHPDARSATEDVEHLADIARLAEDEGRLHMLFFGDGLSTGPDTQPSMLARLEPLTALAALSARTRRIGLTATASTTYGEPYHVARAFASLDHLSGGRAGWNIVTTASVRDAGNFGRDAHPGHAERYERAEEFVDVVTGLWDTWEAGALVRDKAAGRYADPARIHRLDHAGRHFRVAGPLNTSRPPQGRPVLIQAGSSGPGQALAARTADVVFTAQQDIGQARAFYRGIKAAAAARGRDPGQVVVMPGLMPVLGRTRAHAHALFEHLQSLLDERNLHAVVSRRMGLDLSHLAPDAPLPEDLPLGNGLRSRVALLKRLAQRERLTLRDVYRLIASSNGHLTVIGTAEDVADEIERWLRAGAADGFNLMMPYFPGPLADFVGGVVPLLQARGVFHQDYAGRTLRENLGLAPAPSIHPPPSTNAVPA